MRITLARSKQGRGDKRTRVLASMQVSSLLAANCAGCRHLGADATDTLAFPDGMRLTGEPRPSRGLCYEKSLSQEDLGLIPSGWCRAQRCASVGGLCSAILVSLSGARREESADAYEYSLQGG